MKFNKRPIHQTVCLQHKFYRILLMDAQYKENSYSISNFYNDEKTNCFQKLLLLPAASRSHASVASNHYSENDHTKILLIFLETATVGVL